MTTQWPTGDPTLSPQADTSPLGPGQSPTPWAQAHAPPAPVPGSRLLSPVGSSSCHSRRKSRGTWDRLRDAPERQQMGAKARMRSPVPTHGRILGQQLLRPPMGWVLQALRSTGGQSRPLIWQLQDTTGRTSHRWCLGGTLLLVTPKPGHGGCQWPLWPRGARPAGQATALRGRECLREPPQGAPRQSGPQEASTQMAPDEGTEERSRGPRGRHRPTLQPSYYNK